MEFLERKVYVLCQMEIEDEYHFTFKCPTYVEIREKYKDILDPLPPLPNHWIPQI